MIKRRSETVLAYYGTEPFRGKKMMSYDSVCIAGYRAASETKQNLEPSDMLRLNFPEGAIMIYTLFSLLGSDDVLYSLWNHHREANEREENRRIDPPQGTIVHQSP